MTDPAVTTADNVRAILAAFSIPGPVIGRAGWPESRRVQLARRLRTLGYFDAPDGSLDKRAYATALGVAGGTDGRA